MRSSRIVGVLVVLCLGLAVPAGAAGSSPGGSTGGVLPASAAKSTLVQDPAWVALKESGRLSIGPNGAPLALATAATVPASALLSSSVTGKVVEPEGDLYDDAHAAVSDQNYWRFCTAGASDATLAYWANTSAKVTGMAAAYFSEPYGPHIERHWYASSDTGGSSDTSDGYSTVGRAYLMYLAEQVKPPSYSSPGIIDFSVYPTGGGAIGDVRDALNWEASGHSSSWSTFFYLSQNPSESDLHSFVTADIANAHVAVVADVYTGYLPNWSRSVPHSIAIIGYNDTAGTYTYLDTCSVRCNGSSGSKNGGTNTISQHSMYLAIHSLGAGIVW